MTITRCLRSLAAAALAAGLVLPAAASAAGPGGRGGPLGHGGHGAPSYNAHQRHKVDGVVQTMSGTTVPATLTVQTASGATITVTVSATTKLLRGHGGRSNLGEVALGDRITAVGSFETGSATTFDARRLKDESIAYRRVVGNVAGVWSGGVMLLPARGGSPHSLYQRGQEVQVTLTSSTTVISGSVALTGTVNWTQTPPLHVQVKGLYDSASHTLLANRVRILGTSGRHDPDAAATPEAEATATATPTP